MKRLLIPLSVMILMAIPGIAQQKTMVSLTKVKFGKTAEYIAAFNTAIAPALDRLVADGVIQSYGLDVDVLHSAGQPNVVGWFSASSFANLQKAVDASTVAAAAHPSEAKLLMENTDQDTHVDLLLTSSAGKFGKVPEGAKPFTNVAFFKVKPGKESDWSQFGKKYYQPVYDKLVDEGTIYGYQILMQTLHTEDPGSAWVVVTMPDMAAIDKMEAAFEGAMKMLTPSERSMMQGAIRDQTDEAAHRDQLMRAAAFRMK
jgi:hypothetical protein